MSKTVIVLASSLLVILLVIISCTKDKGKIPAKATGGISCDSINYNQDIKPIIETKCSLGGGCHPFNAALNNYADVSSKADRVKARAVDANPSIMPPSTSTVAPLTADEKQLINCWIETGKKEN